MLDEPLSALDAKVRVRLRHEIKELQRQLGVTTIMVTHDQEEALAMADRIVVMNHGVIEQVGAPTEIYRHPETLFVADFIGEMNQMEASAANGSATIGAKTFTAGTSHAPGGGDVIAAIRPEDIVPDGTNGDPANGIKSPENTIDVRIDEMEFLGSFWRTRLQGEALGDIELIADFSINAVRRLSLEEGQTINVELPAERLMVFPGRADHVGGE